MSIKAFEKTFGVEFCAYITCGHEYIEELMFSGLTISPDLEFRKKYLPIIEKSSGDENLVLSFINNHVGYGVFAAKDFQEGDFIVRYGGHLTPSESLKDKSYLMASGVEGMGLNAAKKRNLGGMINHSNNANAESQCVFDCGAELAIITAKTSITKGHQVTIDYSKKYWTKNALKAHKLEDLGKVPALPL